MYNARSDSHWITYDEAVQQKETDVRNKARTEELARTRAQAREKRRDGNTPHVERPTPDTYSLYAENQNDSTTWTDRIANQRQAGEHSASSQHDTPNAPENTSRRNFLKKLLGAVAGAGAGGALLSRCDSGDDAPQR